MSAAMEVSITEETALKNPFAAMLDDDGFADLDLPPHAFHQSLPPHHRNPETGIPYVTTFAHAKAKNILDLVRSIQLTPELFQEHDDDDDGDGDDRVEWARRNSATTANQRSSGHPNGRGVQEEDDDDGLYQHDEHDKDAGAIPMDEEDDDLDMEGDDDDDDILMDDNEPSSPDLETSDPSDASSSERHRNNANSRPTTAKTGSGKSKTRSKDMHVDARPPTSLAVVTKKCARLHAQWNTLEGLKYSGMTHLDLCHMVLHLLRLVTCSVSYQYEEDIAVPTSTATTETSNNNNSNAAQDEPCTHDGSGVPCDEAPWNSNAQLSAGATATTTTIKPRRRRIATLHYDSVGYIFDYGPSSPSFSEPATPPPTQHPVADREPVLADSVEEMEQDLLHRDFALPTPAREILLLVLINFLSNKGPLRSVSNSSLYPCTANEKLDDNNSSAATTNPNERAKQCDRIMLILHWKSFLRMLLRTAPYLDEHRIGNPPKESSSRQSTVLKRTVQLIRDARHFFDQGIRPPFPAESDSSVTATNDELCLDKTAREVWSMVESDVLYHAHTHACYRGSILLYLFQPSRCTSDYYLEVMPLWMECWTNIDRCPEFDFLWLTLFCRARKYVDATDSRYLWRQVRRRLLTSCQYWLSLPIGGTAMDSSFPRAANPRSRSCPTRLKVFAGASSSYEEGIDFVAKVAKLLVAGLGAGDRVTGQAHSDRVGSNGKSDLPSMTEGTNDVLRFLLFATPYFHPSNLGSWTFTLGAFLHYFAYELACRMGVAAAVEQLKGSHADAVEALKKAQPGTTTTIPPHEVVSLMDALLPLCQQALYSKNGHVGRAGEAAMLYLVQIDPIRTTPAFLDFATRALDIGAVNLSHQAPAALSALTRLIQPALRCCPSILLSRLPQILSLSLAGIDSNDQNKTIRTLILYRGICSWLPVGGKAEDWPSVRVDSHVSMLSSDGTMRLGVDLYATLAQAWGSEEYGKALKYLPPSSLLKQGEALESLNGDSEFELLLDEATSAMTDWVLEFLDRVFGLLRASGEREKAGKTSSGVASRHSTADVHQARNFSRVLKECLFQVFAAMNDNVHSLAVRAVVRFLEEETLPEAAKDSSLLCEAVCAARKMGGSEEIGSILSPGLDVLVPVLTNDIQHHSIKTVIYRLRCLAGAVRSAGCAVVKHKPSITLALSFALASDDRHLFKTGCKLLRHCLSTLSESYPISSTNGPRVYLGVEPGFSIGRSAQLHNDGVDWHVPDSACIEFAWSLLKVHVLDHIDRLCQEMPDNDERFRSRLLNGVDVQDLRRCLRVMRYAVRGGSSILLDSTESVKAKDVVPYEMASHALLSAVSSETRQSILQIRGRLCLFIVVLSTVIASDTFYPNEVDSLPERDPYRRCLPLISGDPKVCKETCDIALLLLTRRGSFFRSQGARTLWKAQKQFSADFTLCAQVDHIAEILQSAGRYGQGLSVFSKDGEDAGKMMPRRLVVSRVQLFHASLQRNASFEVPRRLRRCSHQKNGPISRVLFNAKSSFVELICNVEELILGSSTTAPLDCYEGIIDGLYALSCHSNTHVRASAVSVVDYTMTRFGWLVIPRIPRLLSAIALKDKAMNGKFGVPSCALLVDKLNQQGKRKRLAETIKGVCAILSLPRAGKHLLGTEKARYAFAKTICGTDYLLTLLPTEEMQKVVHYLQAVFNPYRSKFFSQIRISPYDTLHHELSLTYVLGVLSEKKAADDDDSPEGGAVHWRKLLLACWFLLVGTDSEALARSKDLFNGTWETCFRIIEVESGQPLQRVALGLLGRLLTIFNDGAHFQLLKDRMETASFCRSLGLALVFDHREDTSVGGGHDAQWSAGVEDIIRDSSRSVAPRTLFPFQRTSQSMGSFKVAHAQLLELILSKIGAEAADTASLNLLVYSRELAAAEPSEDQRNQQITSAEIFAGVCSHFLRVPAIQPKWTDVFLPHLDHVMGKIPFSLSGAYFDALRYSLQFCPPSTFYPLTEWLVEKIRCTLWQASTSIVEDTVEMEESTPPSSVANSSHGADGFTSQSKWMYLFSAVIIEMDDSEDEAPQARNAWYARQLTKNCQLASENDMFFSEDLDRSWRLVTESLLPSLTGALGHPFDSCRDHISRCLFRICYCHRKRKRINASRAPSRSNSILDLEAESHGADSNPGLDVVAKLASLQSVDGWSFNDKYNALSTARRFISNCVHFGEGKFEFSDFVIPLLPLAFEVVKSSVEDEVSSETITSEENAAKRALEAEVIKAYRQMIAEVSITAVISYGKESDITRVIEIVESASRHERWQVRHASANFIRCFQGAHKFLFSDHHSTSTMQIVESLLADERREISSAAMAALTGILAATPGESVATYVDKYVAMAAKTKMKRPRKIAGKKAEGTNHLDEVGQKQESARATQQQRSVFFLCAAVMAHPYETPTFVPVALAAISKHSFERNAPLGVRDAVKKCCAEYKRTHMSDNWELHRSAFSQEQLEALEDVVSSPHYYA